MNVIKISVFTPTYNRVNILPNLYRSMLQQSFTDFEWIIVDDGSSDGTEELIKRWENERKINIRKIVQSNSGKHVAQNRALEIAKGELFLPLDSDDTIIPNALEDIWDIWEGIPKIKRNKICGLGVHCMNSDGEIIGDLWPFDYFESNDLDIYFKYKVRGEKWGPIRTDILKKFPNEEVKGHYLAENTVWFRIAKEYNKIYVNKAYRIYEIQNDSVQGGSTVKYASNPYSKIASSLIYINEFWVWYKKYNKKAGIEKVLIAIKASLTLGENMIFGRDALIKKVDPFAAKIIVLLCVPLKVMYKI